jgi:hypothetical protein
MFALMVGAITGGLMALLKARAALDAQAEFYAVKSLDVPFVTKAINPTVAASTSPIVASSASPTVASGGPTVVASAGPTAVTSASPSAAASTAPTTPIGELLTGSITVRPDELPTTASRDGSARDEEQSEAWDAEAGKKENSRVVTISIRRGRESPLVYVVPRE